jgi:hypothetical protein
MNAAAFCLSVSGLHSPPIRQALPDDAFQSDISAHVVADPEAGAVGHTEVKLSCCRF